MSVPDMTSAPSDVVNKTMRGLNKGRIQPLTRSQLKNQADAKPIFIYNVGTISFCGLPYAGHAPYQGQLGTVVIPMRGDGERVSKPYKVQGKIFRWYDKGLGRKEAFEEEGMDVAMDICGCDPEYPAPSLNNNLTTYGVFITRAPFEELKKAEQESLIDQATNKFIEKLRELILRADQMHAGSDQEKKGIGQIHRDALTAYNREAGSKEERPWAPVRYSAKSVDCQWCGFSNKPGFPICANCKGVINPELHAEMEKKNKSKA
jgi:hypothetical protein